MQSNLNELQFISSVAERDIDFIVLEELEVSEAFSAWFATRVYEIPVLESKIGAWHSVSDGRLGESDLVFLFKADDGSRKSVLIENKIDAPPQPDQGRRYQARGERGVSDGDWDEFRTCIIAPRRYLSSSKHSELYDSEVSYEEIMAYFVSQGTQDKRFTYRARLIQEAIQQNRRGYQAAISEEMTHFVQEYVAYVRKKYSELHVQDAKPRAPGSSWMMFYPVGKGKKTQIAHQLSAGFVKILIGDKADQLDVYRERYADEPIPDLEIQGAGKSVGLALRVPEINPLEESFQDSSGRVDEAMEKLTGLVSLAKSRGDI